MTIEDLLVERKGLKEGRSELTRIKDYTSRGVRVRINQAIKRVDLESKATPKES
jgi:hypothetical protein